MKILFVTGRELSYSRNDVLLRAFRRFSEVDVLAVRHRPSSLILNSLRQTVLALPRLARQRYDLVFIGFYGHLLMLTLGPLSRQPILFDAFVSTYDTLIEDRQMSGRGSLFGTLARWLDLTACRLASRVLLDTKLHADYFVEQYNLPADKFFSCPVGCNEEIFYPRPPPAQSERKQVLYYTSYLPLHGVETVIRAAELLRSEPVYFKLIGYGQTYARVRSLAHDLGLEKISFAPPVPLEKLPDKISAADICLGGHFGLSAKAGRVIPGKIYQLLAMGSPIIATDTPANLALLRHLESAYLVPPGNAEALAQAVMHLAQQPALRTQIADGGRRLYLEQCSELVITEMLRKIVELAKG